LYALEKCSTKPLGTSRPRCRRRDVRIDRDQFFPDRGKLDSGGHKGVEMGLPYFSARRQSVAIY